MTAQHSQKRSVKNLAKLLGQFRLFEGVSEESLAALDEVFTLQKLPRGHLLTKFDAVESHVFFILGGIVQVSVPHASRNSDELLCELKERDTVGEFLLVRKARRSASCTAFSEVEVLVADAEDLKGAIEAKSAVGMLIYQNLSRILCERLHDNNMLIRRVIGSG